MREEYTAAPEMSGMRLDRFLAEQTEYSRSFLQKLIRGGEIIRRLPEEELLPALKEELDHWK